MAENKSQQLQEAPSGESEVTIVVKEQQQEEWDDQEDEEKDNGELDHLKTLVIFDFDNTIINANSDTILLNLLERLDSKQSEQDTQSKININPHLNEYLPMEILSQYEDNQWTKFMNIVFKYLFDQGVTEQEFKDIEE